MRSVRSQSRLLAHHRFWCVIVRRQLRRGVLALRLLKVRRLVQLRLEVAATGVVSGVVQRGIGQLLFLGPWYRAGYRLELVRLGGGRGGERIVRLRVVLRVEAGCEAYRAGGRHRGRELLLVGLDGGGLGVAVGIERLLLGRRRRDVLRGGAHERGRLGDGNAVRVELVVHVCGVDEVLESLVRLVGDKQRGRHAGWHRSSG